jgi:hypothetical protein
MGLPSACIFERCCLLWAQQLSAQIHLLQLRCAGGRSAWRAQSRDSIRISL